MAKKYGIYEVDEKEGYVRVAVEDDYEYIVTPEKYGKNAVAACHMFSFAYNLGKTHTQDKIRGALGL